MSCAVSVLGARLRRREARETTNMPGESQRAGALPTGTVSIPDAHNSIVNPHSPRAQPAHNAKQAGERESDETYCADAQGTNHVGVRGSVVQLDDSTQSLSM